MAQSEEGPKSGSQDKSAEVEVLRNQIRGLESEISLLRRKVSDSPKRLGVLEERLLQTKGQLTQAANQNEKLTSTIREAREHIATLREEVNKLTQPPSAYGTFMGHNEDGSVDVYVNGRKMRVVLHPDLTGERLETGCEVVLNESFNVMLVRKPGGSGEVVTVKEILDDQERAVISGRGDDEKVVELAEHLREKQLRAGDYLLLDSRANVAIERLPRPELEDLLLEEVPDVSYEDIGGLRSQIEQITDAVELPYLHQDLFKEYDLPAPKGILLYGPPGCGKTLIAKAVANSLAKKVAVLSGDKEARSFFINIKGPELLNKYVGETERQIRQIYLNL